MNKSTLSIIGFLLFFFGFFSLILSIVGIKIVFLLWMDNLGMLGSFLFKLFMIIAGIVIIMVARGDEARHDEFFEEQA